MFYRLYSLASVALISGAFFCAARGGDINSAPDSFLTSRGDTGWSVGISTGFDKREILVGGELDSLDANHFVAQLDYAVLPFAALVFQGGYSRADGLLDGDGERGVEWGVGVDFNVLEYVFDDSPVFGDLSRIGFQVKARFRSMQSNFEDSDFDWTETSIVPLVYYAVSYDRQIELHKYNPDRAAIKGGLVFNSIDGELGDSDLEENRDFGMMLGMDLMFAENWLTTVEGAFFENDDREVTIAMLYRF